MKRTFVQLFSIICAVYFLIAGTGFNLVRYCCDGCAKEGIEVIAEKSCTDIHQDHHDEGNCCSQDASDRAEHKSCGDISHETDCCYSYRVQTDAPSLLHNVVNLVPENESILFVFDFLFTEYIQVDKLAFVPPDNVPPRSGRDVLAYHAILLI